MKILPNGVYPMLYSFFDENGGIRPETYEIQVEAAIRSQANGIAILGLGSEVSKLTTLERISMLRTVSNALNKRKPLLTTIHGNSPEEQIEFGKQAIRCGTDVVILQPPKDPLPNSKLLTFFSRVIKELDIPAGIQNAPEFMGFGLNTNSIVELASQHENFVIVKLECSAVQLQVVAERLKFLKENVMVFNGRCGLELTDNLRAGATGIIPGIETIRETSKIFNYFTSKKIRESDELYSKLAPVLCFIMQGIPHFLTYGKMLAAKRLGLELSGFRKPALNPTEFGSSCVKRFFNQLGKL